ncbi:DUF3307 domain-containing protein [Sphingobacterium corticis]|uniref:DUF3307 domain-containing protein n=1 Tax=Sphingobacterium corticis TaxID=1812823 RepID=A0ABW5NJR8_9SPHI
MLIIFLQFLVAHVLGDFVFQTKTLVAKRKQNILYLLLHVGIHGLALSLVFCQSLTTWWPGIVFVLATHLAIDSFKILYERKWKSRPFQTFIIDQALHLAMIFLVMFYYFPNYFQHISLWTPVNLLYLLTLLVLLFVTPIMMRTFFAKWDTEHAFTGKKEETLLDAGLVIGILERIMVVVFIQMDFLSGIGFLIGAKSIFRFGDLTNAKNTKFTEYILVGTFLSYALALGIGVMLKLALTWVS